MTDIERVQFDAENEMLNGICPGLYRDATQDKPITSPEERVKSTCKAGLIACIIGIIMEIIHMTGDISGRLAFGIVATAFVLAAVFVVNTWRKR